MRNDVKRWVRCFGKAEDAYLVGEQEIQVNLNELKSVFPTGDDLNVVHCYAIDTIEKQKFIELIGSMKLDVQFDYFIETE